MVSSVRLPTFTVSTEGTMSPVDPGVGVDVTVGVGVAVNV